MKWIRLFFTVVIFSIFTVNANAASVAYNGNAGTLDSIVFSPDPATSLSNITAAIQGTLSLQGYAVSPNAEITSPDNQNNIFISLFIVESAASNPDGVASPFEVLADIGLLAVGIYNVKVDLWLQGHSIDSITSQLEVSAVPLPAAVWLLLSGLISLFAFGKKSGTALKPAH